MSRQLIAAVAAVAFGWSLPAAADRAKRKQDRSPPRADVVAKTAPPVARDHHHVRFAIESGPMWRQLRYRDAIHGDVRTYDLAAPSLAGQIAVARSGLELRAAFQLAVAVEGSRDPEMAVYPTRSSEWQAAIAYTTSLRGLAMCGELGGGSHRFSISEPVGEPALVPDTASHFARGAVGVAAAVRRGVSVRLGIGWRQLLSTGELSSAAWFPRATGNGIDASLGIEWALTRSIDIHLRGELRRYFFALHPEVGDPVIAGGASDQYVGFAAGLTLGAL